MKLRALGIAMAGALLGACTALTLGYASPALDALFNAERAFARAAASEGIAAAFDRYLAADAVVFRPGPVTWGAYRAEHAPAPGVGKTLLEWAPQDGAVSHAGDLGYTTGPFRVSRRGEPATLEQGYFFSVWRHTDAGWRVVLDAGVTTDAPPPQEGLPNMLAPLVDVRVPRDITAESRAASRERLLARERTPHSLTLAPPDVPGALPSFYTWLTPTTRWLRDGPPAAFGDAIRAELQAAGGRIDWTPIDANVAASDDFAWTYGRYTRTPGTGAPTQGYYVHVWQRDDRREWRLAAIVWLALA